MSSGRDRDWPGWLTRLWPWLVWLILGLIIAGIIFAADRFIPKQHLPWAKLETDRPLGLATKSQLFRLSLSPSKTCMDLARNTADLVSIPADPKRPNDICGWDIARVVYGRGGTELVGEANMQCPLSIGAYLWMRELDVLAQERFGSGLAKMHHMGTYSCRRQRGNGSGRWSEHAFANAWDIAAFELEDSTLIRVQTDWDGETDKREFLRDARDLACDIFKVTLSPDYNAAHYDHFHIDMGPSSACR